MHRALWRPSLLLAAFSTAVACSSEAPRRLSPPTLERLVIEPASVLVVISDRFELAATAIYSDGREEAVTSRVDWAVADDGVLRLVDGSRFEGTAVGDTQIEARFEEAVATVAVTVSASPLAMLRIQPGTATIEAGQTQDFKARGTFEDGSQADLTDQVEWRSEDAAVATVVAGVATASSAGNIDIVARLGDIEAEARLNVRPARLMELSIEADTREIPLGGTQQLTAVGVFSNGAVRNVTEEVDWRSDDETILTVGDDAGSKGLVTTVAVGRTAIFVEGSNQAAASVSLRVTEPNLVALEVRPRTSTITAGEERFFTAVAVRSDGSQQIVTRDVQWRSSAPQVVRAPDTVVERGQIIGRSAGQATISVFDGESGISSRSTGGDAYVTVLPPTLRSIVVSPQTADVPAGLTQQMTATGYYSDDSNRNLTASVEWASSDATLAPIDAAGLLTGVNPGTVTVTARDPMTGVVSTGPANGTITVLPPILQSFEIAPTMSSLIEEDTQAFTAVGSFSDNVDRDISSQVIWRSNSAAIRFSGATATAVRAGTATVTATARGVTASNQALVTVIPLRLVDLQVTPATANLIVGTEVQFAASGTYNNTQVLDLTDAVTWTSSDPAVASVLDNGDPNAGLATANLGGATTISVTDPVTGASSDDFGGSARLTVSSTVALVSLAVSSPVVQTTIGRPEPMTALGTFSNGAVLQMTNTVQWTTSDPTVAVISNVAGMRGVLTGVGTGTVSPMALHTPTGIRSTTNPVIDMLLPPIFNGSWNGPTVTVDGTGTSFRSVGSVNFTAAQIGATTVVADVDIRINFLKTDGSCAAPGSGNAFHNETGFRLRSPAGTLVTMVAANSNVWTGSGALPGPVDVTFDDEAPNPTPSNAIPTTGTYRPSNPLTAFDGSNPRGIWRLEAQDSAGADPLCVNNYTITLTVR